MENSLESHEIKAKQSNCPEKEERWSQVETNQQRLTFIYNIKGTQTATGET